VQANNPAIITNKLSHGSKYFTTQLKQQSTAAQLEAAVLKSYLPTVGTQTLKTHY